MSYIIEALNRLDEVYLNEVNTQPAPQQSNTQQPITSQNTQNQGGASYDQYTQACDKKLADLTKLYNEYANVYKQYQQTIYEPLRQQIISDDPRIKANMTEIKPKYQDAEKKMLTMNAALKEFGNLSDQLKTEKEQLVTYKDIAKERDITEQATKLFTHCNALIQTDVLKSQSMQAAAPIFKEASETVKKSSTQQPLQQQQQTKPVGQQQNVQQQPMQQ